MHRRWKVCAQKLPKPAIEKGYIPGTSDYAFYARGDVQVPDRISVIAGEIIHHLRSSLDQLVAHLVAENGATVSRSHQFPICASAEQFESSISRGYLKGIAIQVENIIRSHQPFLQPDPNTSALRALQEFNNSDKHRLLVVVAAATRIGREVRLNMGEPAVVTEMSPPSLAPLNGRPFFVIHFQQPYEKTDVEVDVDVQLALQRPADLDWPFEFTPLIQTLAQFNALVRGIVESCYPRDSVASST